MSKKPKKKEATRSTCNVCHGTGRVTCEICHGRGRNESGQPCTACKGKGIVECSTCNGIGATIYSKI